MTFQPTPEITSRIRVLNDAFRTTFVGGAVMCTSGFQSLPLEQRARVLTEVRSFTSFNEANDPHDEHDFGVIETKSEPILFKIDYYDLDMTMHSPDPTDPEVTRRVLTIMLASEY